MKRISLLGATGSIGIQTLEVIREHPEEFKLVSMSAGRNIVLCRKIIHEFQPELVSVQEKEDADRLKSEFPSVKIVHGLQGLEETAVFNKAEILVNAILGSVGLKPTLEAIRSGKTIAIANKETLVTAGHIVMDEAKRNKVTILPVDSEHSAIFQALQGEKEKNIERIILTASGGSFRDRTREELHGVTKSAALNHPNWSMGAKITIDSATMMNKGLEVIEAHWLFSLPYDAISVLLHQESIVHSMVEFHDTSIIAQLGTPNMKVPIQYALTYPDRLPFLSGKRLNLSEIGSLHFKDMDLDRFRCLKFAYDAGRAGGTMPAVMNAANEAAVAAFLQDRISFLQIEDLIEKAMEHHIIIGTPDLETIQEADRETRNYVNSLI